MSWGGLLCDEMLMKRFEVYLGGSETSDEEVQGDFGGEGNRGRKKHDEIQKGLVEAGMTRYC